MNSSSCWNQMQCIVHAFSLAGKSLMSKSGQKNWSFNFQTSEYLLHWAVFHMLCGLLPIDYGLTALTKYDSRKGQSWLLPSESVIPHSFMCFDLAFITAQCLVWQIFKRVFWSIRMLISHLIPLCLSFSALVSRLLESTIQENKARQDYVGLIEVPDSYDGPRLQFPLTFTDIDLLLQAFKQQQVTSSRSCSGSHSQLSNAWMKML